MPKKSRLGKGLGALIPNSEENLLNYEKAHSKEFGYLNPKVIRPNPYQPRLGFEDEALNGLKQSIKENGLIQPISVRKVDGGYELIAGERRLRSVLELGLESVPAYILDVKEKEQMLEMALIENVQREKLNMIELAISYKRLINECNLVIEDVAKKIGKDRSTVNNIIRLLKLPKFVQEQLSKNKLSMGQARALLAVKETSTCISLAKKTIQKELSVRKVEALVRSSTRAPSNDAKLMPSSLGNEMSKEKLNYYKKVESQIRESLGTKAQVKRKKDGGLIEISFYDDGDLQRLYELFCKLE